MNYTLNSINLFPTVTYFKTFIVLIENHTTLKYINLTFYNNS